MHMHVTLYFAYENIHNHVILISDLFAKLLWRGLAYGGYLD